MKLSKSRQNNNYMFIILFFFIKILPTYILECITCFDMMTIDFYELQFVTLV